MVPDEYQSAVRPRVSGVMAASSAFCAAIRASAAAVASKMVPISAISANSWSKVSLAGLIERQAAGET
ncbi:hypothetical protein D3C87_2034640 [compost metagenome]